MKLIYNVEDKPKFGQLVAFALQQLLAIMAATLVVPVIVSSWILMPPARFSASTSSPHHFYRAFWAATDELVRRL